MEGVIGMNLEWIQMYLLHLVFGSTPYYIIVFLIVKRGGVDVSIINGSQGSQHSLTFIRTRTFFLIV